MTTTSEACGKWCPFSRVGSRDGGGGANRLQMFDQKGVASGIIGSTCVGEHCMAWRWTSPEQVFGFCGLAGHPVQTAGE